MRKDKESYIKIMKISKYDYNSRLSEELKNKYKLIKHYSRMCLSRYHVRQLLKTNLNDFIKMHVGDEFFLSSIMPLKHYKNIAITHDDWEYVISITDKIRKEIYDLYEKKPNNYLEKILELKGQYNDLRKNPKKIIKVDKSDLYNISNTKSFFYRKFDKDSDIRDYIYKFI
jgi:hypothetical protein